MTPTADKNYSSNTEFYLQNSTPFHIRIFKTFRPAGCAVVQRVVQPVVQLAATCKRTLRLAAQAIPNP